MLAETDAWALLEQHCALLRVAAAVRGCAGARSSDTDADSGRDRVNLVVGPRRDYQATALKRKRSGGTAVDWEDFGARLRLAVEVAGAVANCRGFEPATHQAFWRHVATMLWRSSGTIADRVDGRFAFSRNAFARVGVAWHAITVDDDAFWLGFLHSSAACQATLASVRETLQRLSGRDTAKPLQLVLIQSSTKRTSPLWDDGSRQLAMVEKESTVEPEALRTILRAALDTAPRATWHAMPTHLDLVVEYRIDDNAYVVQETLDLLTRAHALPHIHVTIGRLAIQLAPPVPPRCAGSDPCHRRALVTRGRALGSVLRSLLVATDPHRVRVDAVAVFGCSHSDYRLVGAVLSAVALGSSPPVSRLLCSRLSSTIEPQDNLLRLAWLAFALQCRDRACQPVALALLSSIGDVLSEHESEHVSQLRARGMPLRDVVSDALRLRFGGSVTNVIQVAVDYLIFGSTVRLKRGTALYVEPMRIYLDESLVVVTLEKDEQVDAVARVGVVNQDEWVGIVYAGYGLVWTPTSGVVAWQGRGRVVEALMARDMSLPLTSLTLSCGHAHTMTRATDSITVATVRFLASATIETLTITRAVIPRDTLALLLERLPLLQTLALDDCVVESLAPLVDPSTPRRSRPQLSSLSLRRIQKIETHVEKLPSSRITNLRQSEAWVAELLDVATHAVTDGGALRALHVDLQLSNVSTAYGHAALARLADVVMTSRSLTRLHVVSRKGFEKAGVEVLTLLRDTVLADPPAVRVTVLSVLRTFGCGGREVATQVLALAEGAMVRTVTWATT